LAAILEFQPAKMSKISIYSPGRQKYQQILSLKPQNNTHQIILKPNTFQYKHLLIKHFQYKHFQYKPFQYKRINRKLSLRFIIKSEYKHGHTIVEIKRSTIKSTTFKAKAAILDVQPAQNKQTAVKPLQTEEAGKIILNVNTF